LSLSGPVVSCHKTTDAFVIHDDIFPEVSESRRMDDIKVSSKLRGWMKETLCATLQRLQQVVCSQKANGDN